MPLRFMTFIAWDIGTKKMEERTKISNLMVGLFSLTFVNLLLAWILYLHVWLKGCLCYKTITSQNVSSEKQIKNFFILKNYIPFSRYSSFCIFNHLMIYQICDVTMSISTWDKAHFWIYLLNHNSWSHQTWQFDR